MSDKKNALIVSPTKIGLTETFIRAHIDNLDAHVFYLYGWELDYKTDDDLPLEKLYQPKQTLINKLISLLPHYLYFRLKRKEKKQYSKEALIKRYIKENNIQLVLAEYGTAGSFIAPICEEINIPLFVHFHGLDASKYKTLEMFRDRYLYMFKVAKKVIAVSNAMHNALIEVGCSKEKLIINPYGPHPDYDQLNLDDKNDNIIAVGRHTYKKAPYLTILAFQKVLKVIPYLKLKMVGDGELFDVSKNLVKSLGLENEVFLLGGLERAQIIEELQSSFLFVQHSIVAYNGDSEGTPVGIIEAMAAGLPVVSTRHAGIPDVVIEGETGLLVNENQIDEMANQIIYLAKNRDKAREMGLKGKFRISSTFSFEKHIETLNNLINAE
jgi:colanic acid/amylovoran biosynthesis glycosyltransferase